MSAGNVGFTTAKFSTTKSGQSAYHVPIKVPPGTRRMQPSISLSYIGNQHDGLAGVGATLSGLPTITRVGQTIGQDGNWTAVNYSPSDRFALAGERLIAIKGKYGASGTEYRTERESWARILSFGDQGGGPEWFEVTERNGRKMQFGNTPDSRVPLTGGTVIRCWGLNRASDLNGNYYTVSYQSDLTNGVHRPSAIDYTGNDNIGAELKPSRQVVFSYEDRPDPIHKFCGGYGFIETQRLTVISTFVGTKPVRTYKLGYNNSAVTNRSELATIVQYDGQGVPLPPLTLKRPQETSSWLAAPAPLSSLPADVVPSDYSLQTGDLTGNGRTDLIFYWAAGNDSLFSYAVLLADVQGGYSAPVTGSTNCSLSGGSTGPVPLDITGDGSTDFVLAYMQNSTLVSSTLVWDGTELTVSKPAPMGLDDLPDGLVPQIVPVDIDGDGLSELFIPFATADNTMSAYMMKHHASGFEMLGNVQSLEVPMLTSFSSMLVAANVSGSPVQEIIYGFSGPSTNDIYTMVFDGTKIEPGTPLSLTEGVGALNTFVPVRTRDDGLTDLAFFWQNSTTEETKMMVLHSDGLKIAGADNQTAPLCLGTNAPAVSTVELTGCGRTDLLLYTLDSNGNVAATPYIGCNGSFKPQPSIQTQLDVQPAAITTPDIMGLGRNDLMISTLDTTNQSITLHLARASSKNFGLVETITNGIGGSIDIEYLPISDPQVYTAANSSKDTDELAVTGRSGAMSAALVTFGAKLNQIGIVRNAIELPFKLVASVSRSDGQGNSYVTKHAYQDGLICLSGFGWLGFAEMKVTNLDTSATTVSVYNQKFPLSGRPLSVTTSLKDSNSVLRERSFTYSVETPTNPRVYSILVQKKETVLPSSISADDSIQSITYSYDAYGNRLQSHYASSGAGADAGLAVNREFENDVENWCLGLVTSVKAAPTTTPDNLLWSRNYSHDPTTKQITKTEHVKTSDLDDSPIYTFTYDFFGNRNAITSNNGASTQYDFTADTYFTYATTRRRKASESVTLTDSYTYDMRFGFRTSHKDPNGNSSHRTPDSLGRLSSVTTPGPNGEVVTIKIEWQSALATGYQQITTKLVDWNGATSRQTTKGFDGLGRVTMTEQMGLGAPQTLPRRTQRKLNSVGQATAKSLPYHPGQQVQWVINSYDALGRLTKRVYPYVSGNEETTKIIYDGSHRTVIRADGSPNAVQTSEKRQFFNGHSRAVETTNGLGDKTQFSYDQLGRLRQTTPPESATQSIDYDSLSIPTQVQSDQFGTMTAESSFVQRKANITIANGATRSASTDLLARPTEILLSDGLKYQLSYDESGPGNRLGRLSSVVAATDETEIFKLTPSYSPTGRRTKVALSVSGTEYQQERSWGPTGDLQNLVYNDKTLVDYAFDGLSQIREVSFKDQNGKTTTLASYDDYTAYGQPTKGSAGNSVARSWSYLPSGLLSEINVLASEGAHTALLSRRMERDVFGRITKISDASSGKVLDAYTYDEIGQLKTWTDEIGKIRNLQYDAAGNILNTGTRKIVYGQNEITVEPESGSSYIITSDKAGNRISVKGSDGDQNYSYDAFNRLQKVDAQSFAYTAKGRRLTAADTSGDQTVYISPSDIVRTNGGDVTAIKVIRDPVGVTALVQTGPDNAQVFHYLERDQVKSTILVTDAEGKVVTAPRYEPFGLLLTPSVDISPFLPGFSGQPFDANTGLNYFNARYYDPAIGRFITADTRLGAGLTTPNALNRFAFVLNDPINFADPSGHGLFDWIFAAIVDLLEIVAGAVADAFGLEPLGNALIGAGIGGIGYEVSAAISGSSFSWLGWGISEGVGAIMGAAGVDDPDAVEGVDGGGNDGDSDDGGGDNEDQALSDDERDEPNRGVDEDFNEDDLSEEDEGVDGDGPADDDDRLFERLHNLPAELQYQIGGYLDANTVSALSEELPAPTVVGALEEIFNANSIEALLEQTEELADWEQYRPIRFRRPEDPPL